MPLRHLSLTSGSVALGALALTLAACGPKPTAPPEPGSTLTAAAAPASGAADAGAAQSGAAETAAAAPTSEAAAPEAAPAATAAAGPTSAPPGMIPLQIKNSAGAPVFGNPDAGKQVEVVCSACHSLQAGQNMVGPSLHGIIGRHSGIVPGFHYSSANKNSGLVWTEQELYAYLENPQKVVPGTYMTYTGVKDPQQRADVIAYLQEATK
jgi:cytochrome c